MTRVFTFVSPGGLPRRFWPFAPVSFCGACVVVKGGGLVRFGSHRSLLIVFANTTFAGAVAGSVFIT